LEKNKVLLLSSFPQACVIHNSNAIVVPCFNIGPGRDITLIHSISDTKMNRSKDD